MAKRKGLAVQGLLAKRSSIDLSPAIKAPKRKPSIIQSAKAKIGSRIAKVSRG
jgi:hypothetical protein